MKAFLDALRESIITQALITVAVVGVWLYLIATGQQVPENLSGVLTLVIGFYFGSKVGFRQGEQSQAKLNARRVNDLTPEQAEDLHHLIDQLQTRKKR